MTESRKVTVRVAGNRSLQAVRELDEEAQQLRELLAHATEFTFRPDYGPLNDEFADDPEGRDAIVLEWRGPSKKGGDPDRWAIKWHHHDCWSRRKQTFVYEMSAGNRTDKFIADTRFTLEEAVALVPELLQRLQNVKIPELRRLVESWAQQEAVAAGEAP